VTFETGSKLSRIESGAFRDCSSLSSICILSSVEKLYKSCFYGCKALSDVTFEAGSQLLRIEDRAFSFCSSLCSICIPSSVIVISKNCFSGCNALSYVTFETGSKICSRPMRYWEP
jgi:hypothetical protein